MAQVTKQEELAALRREFEANIQAQEEHQENQGDPWIHQDCSAGDLAWLRHVGKLRRIIPEE